MFQQKFPTSKNEARKVEEQSGDCKSKGFGQGGGSAVLFCILFVFEECVE
jgi:hypothetical protein